MNRPDIPSLKTFAQPDIYKLQRKAYLQSKDINPNQPFQLSLLFPNTIDGRDDKRFLVNDYARSSLFTARSKCEPRKTLLHEKLYHYNQHIELLYTGIELRAEDDEIAWMQFLHYGKGTPFGSPFEFSIKDLVLDLGWPKNGYYYDKARACISRLKANEVLALNSKAYGKSAAISLISNYESINDSHGKPTHFRAWIDPNLIVLFAGNTFAGHSWQVYRRLSPVSRRLADYVASHKHPYPLKVETFRQMCASNDKSLGSWRQTVGNACAEVEAAGIAARAMLKNDVICIVRE